MAQQKGWGERGSNGSRTSTRERRVVRKAASRLARRVKARLFKQGAQGLDGE